MDTDISKLPTLVSYPRVGSHQLKCALELYFDRPCYFGPGQPGGKSQTKRITFLDPERTDWLFAHAHDLAINMKFDRTFYMYRDPVDTVYSAVRAAGMPDETAMIHALRYRAHLLKYLVSSEKSQVSIRYDDFQDNPLDAMLKAILFLQPKNVFNPVRVMDILEQVTKEALVAKGKESGEFGGYYDTPMLTESYWLGRREFRAKWSSKIYEIVRVPELQSFIPEKICPPPAS